MSVVRELLVRLGVDFDAKGADQAEQRVNKLSGLVGKLAAGWSLWQVGSFLKDMTDASSAAEQGLQKLHMSFKDGTKDVVAWARATEDATGYSQDSLIEMAGTFGGMLVPTLKGNRDLAAEMSKSLSALAVDLGAINNQSPEEAMGRLFSAMTGSSEAVDQFGINIKESALAEYAREKGIKQQVRTMTNAQKAELIYGKILADTADKQGAASKESDTYAGRMLKLGSAYKTFMKGGGDQIKNWASDYVIKPLSVALKWITELVTKTTILRTLLLAGSAALVAWGISWVVANAPLLIMVAGIAVLIAALDDLMGYFSGKKSLMGTFFRELNDGLDMLVKNIKPLQRAIKLLGDTVEGSFLKNYVARPAVGVESNVRMRKSQYALRRAARGFYGNQDMTAEERAAIDAEQDAELKKARGGLTLPAAQLPGVRIPLPAGGTVVNEGAVNVNLSGVINREAVTEAEKAARRLMESRDRRTFGTTRRAR
jgi:hypothetical protein